MKINNNFNINLLKNLTNNRSMIKYKEIDLYFVCIDKNYLKEISTKTKKKIDFSLDTRSFTPNLTLKKTINFNIDHNSSGFKNEKI